MGWTLRDAYIAGALSAAVVLAGCGGSKSPGDDGAGVSSGPAASLTTTANAATAADTTSVTASTTTTTPATTVASTTPESTVATTTTDPRPIDPEDQALALAGRLTADAYAAPWTVYSEGASAPVSSDSCSYRPDGAVTKLTNGAAQDGPTMKLGDTGAFVSSSSLAFPDETLAKEYVAIVNTDVWSACFAAQLQRIETANGGDYAVKVASREDPALNTGGFESTAEFDVTSATGSLDRVLYHSLYRYGREVIVVNQEYGGLSDADRQKTFDDSYAALLAAYNRVVLLLG